MDPGSQQANCLSSESSDSEGSSTKGASDQNNFAYVQADGSQTVSPTSSSNSRRRSEDGELGSPNSETRRDNDSAAGGGSTQSSTVEYEQESFETYQLKVS